MTMEAAEGLAGVAASQEVRQGPRGPVPRRADGVRLHAALWFPHI